MTTLEDIKGMERDTITPAIAAQVIGCDPHYIRVAARQCPNTLGFKVIVYGRRTKIPRLSFIRYMEEG